MFVPVVRRNLKRFMVLIVSSVSICLSTQCVSAGVPNLFDRLDTSNFGDKETTDKIDGITKKVSTDTNTDINDLALTLIDCKNVCELCIGNLLSHILVIDETTETYVFTKKYNGNIHKLNVSDKELSDNRAFTDHFNCWSYFNGNWKHFRPYLHLGLHALRTHDSDGSVVYVAIRDISTYLHNLTLDAVSSVSSDYEIIIKRKHFAKENSWHLTENQASPKILSVEIKEKGSTIFFKEYKF